VAEYDDAALMKVAAADRLGAFPLPTVAVGEALARSGFASIGQTQGCSVQFYAITAERKLTHPAVVAMTANARGATAKRPARSRNEGPERNWRQH